MSRKSPHGDIPLPSIEAVRGALSYDPKTGVFVWLSGRRAGKMAGCPHAEGYWQIQLQGRVFLAQRLAWFWMTGEWPRHQVDHRKRIRDDNRWEELREATPSENSWNSPGWKITKSGIKGVYRTAALRPAWMSRIAVNGRDIYLGSFSTKEDAAKAYEAASRKYHGEFGTPAYRNVGG